MPNSDNITRRLKKLFIMMSKFAESEKGFFFENEENLIERTELDLIEKNVIVQELLDNGIPSASDSISEWSNLKDKISERLKKQGIKNTKFDGKNV